MGETLKGKVAVVTGSGGGIGRAVALLMAAEGAKVVVNDLGAPPSGEGGSPAMADETVALIRDAGGEAVAVYDSVATMEGARNIIGTAIDAFGRIDCLVNNAGNTRVNMVWDMPEEDFDAVVRTHLKGTFCTVKAAAPYMIEQRSGSIVNVASGMAIEGGAGVSNYTAAKGGIIGFSNTLCLELGVYGIRVNVLCPSATSRMREAGVDWLKKYRIKLPAAPPGRAPRLARPQRGRADRRLSRRRRRPRRQRPGLLGRRGHDRRLSAVEHGGVCL